MLDREVVKKLVETQLNEWETDIPNEINFDKLIDAFILYIENDYYDWLKDNLHSFFVAGTDGIDWAHIKMLMEKYQQE